MLKQSLVKRCACAAVLLCATGIHAAEFHIAPSGSDTNPGTAAGPFATLAKACAAARGQAGSTVWLHGGTYFLNETLLLTPADSGLTIRAVANETPVLHGGRLITGWRPLVAEPAGVAGAAKGKLWTAEIPTDWRFHYLYINEQPAPRAKLDNRHWRQWPQDFSYKTPGPNGQELLFKNKKILENLPVNGDVEMICIMTQYGVQGNGVLTKIDAAAGTAVWNSNQTYVGFRNRHRNYTLENALPFIDQPGEWCVDSAAGRVYYWPRTGEDLTTATVTAPKLYEMIRLQGDETAGKWVEKITLRGLTLAFTDRLPEDQWPAAWIKRQWEHVDAMLYLEGVRDCTIADNRLLFSGASGMTLNHYCQGVKVEGNEVAWPGSNGIFLCGYGPGTLDVNRDNIISRNWLHDMGQGNYWHSNGIQIYQSGHNRITKNLVQNSAYSSISMSGCAPLFLQDPAFFFQDSPKAGTGQFKLWDMFKIRAEEFTKELQDGVRNGTKPFNRETIKQYMHSNGNLIENNIVAEPEQILDEGGAIYAWCSGKGNIWKDNLIFKSTGMPGSSILALDDLAEYFTITGNVIWVEGRAACGTIGMRADERGNVIKDNIRANFKPQFADTRNSNANGVTKGFYTTDTTREPVYRLLREITAKVAADGGWLGNPKTGIPAPGEPVTAPDQKPKVKMEHVTIE